MTEYDPFEKEKKAQLKKLDQGVDVWNKWRKEQPDVHVYLDDTDFTNAKLPGIDFREANLSRAKFVNADLSYGNFSGGYIYNANFRSTRLIGANFSKGNLSDTDFSGANLTNANFSDANLNEAKLSYANLQGAQLTNCNLYNADLRKADLTGADLRAARLDFASLDEAIIEQTTFTHCSVYAVSTWGIEGNPKEQSGLLITPYGQTAITVDDLQLAQFIYFLLTNHNIRNLIDTITSKVVLILGRFTTERKAVLDAIREELRKRNFTPILFDFEKPASKDLTGTVETLARMARFIIADLTDPSSIPHELATIIPFLRTTPVLPLKLANSQGYGMFNDMLAYPWVLNPYLYADEKSLIAELSQVIVSANQKWEELRNHRQLS